jgi:glycosyltransferase involved in cell wall biosynthesis
MTMRVLHVSPGKLYGGVESFQVTMAQHRALCADMEPEFATCFAGRLAEELRPTSAPTDILGEVRVSRPLTIVRARSNLKAILKRGRYSIVICHMPWTNAVFGPVVRTARLPLVFWMHGATDGKHWTEKWSRLTPPDFAICPSEFTRALLPNLFPHVDGAVINYPVGPAERDFRPERGLVRDEFATSRDGVVIIQVSRMEAMKGHFLHVEALSLLKSVPGWTCWMVGGAQQPDEQVYFDRLKARARELGISDRIRFTGDRRDVPRLLAAADVYCQPNISNEGLPVAFTEALYAGLPIISTKICGFWETVDESCGRLVEPGSTEAIAREIRHLVLDDKLRARLGEGGRLRARSKFHPSVQLPKLERLLKEHLDHVNSRAA